MKKLIILAILGASQVVFASGTSAVAVSDSTAVSGSMAANEGNAQNITFTNPEETRQAVTYKGSYRVKNTPDIMIGSPASGPCTGLSGGVALSLPGLGLSANAAAEDKGCTVRETARIAHSIGRPDIANALLENLDIVQTALQAKADRDLKAPK